MSEPEKTIKVVDRRMFTADGQLRDEVRAELDKPDEPAPAAAAPPAEPVIASDPAFLRLLDMLAQTASLYLSGIPDPATGQRQPDLHGARQIVDSLAALREKTRGRLSFEETDAIEGLLGELQLAFARLTAPPKGKGPVPPVPRRG
ncbi:MAG TPA: DUF1844 domain-containing protein [Thermoanaerobaculia bacterium]|jgi:hypothetical protein|nr:DUF1844 domain-containing protein [Thermoanaerobaculia bacterium]